MTGHIATADVDISASPAQVWQALTDPEQIRRYLFGARVDTTWEPGDPITWAGQIGERSYVDHGEVVEVTPEQRLVVTHFSPLSGQEDSPENYHRLCWELSDQGDHTHLRLEQDNNATADAAAESEQNWETVVRGLKDLVERG